MVSLIILLAPAIATVLLFRTPADQTGRIHKIALVATTICLLGAIWMWLTHDAGGERFQFMFRVSWIESMGLSFALGVDGISITMVLLTALVIWTGCFVSRSITDRVKEHYILLMALVTGVFGVFLSLDLFFLFFFYEMAVIPMYLLIGVWGSRAAQYSKEFATMKLTLYLTAGAVLALIGLLAIYNAVPGEKTFFIPDIIKAGIADGTQRLWFHCHNPAP